MDVVANHLDQLDVRSESKGRRDHQRHLRFPDDGRERGGRRHPPEGDAGNPDDAARRRDLDDGASGRSPETTTTASGRIAPDRRPRRQGRPSRCDDVTDASDGGGTRPSRCSRDWSHRADAVRAVSAEAERLTRINCGRRLRIAPASRPSAPPQAYEKLFAPLSCPSTSANFWARYSTSDGENKTDPIARGPFSKARPVTCMSACWCFGFARIRTLSAICVALTGLGIAVTRPASTCFRNAAEATTCIA